jgi:hypothetical protein
MSSFYVMFYLVRLFYCFQSIDCYLCFFFLPFNCFVMVLNFLICHLIKRLFSFFLFNRLSFKFRLISSLLLSFIVQFLLLTLKKILNIIFNLFLGYSKNLTIMQTLFIYFITLQIKQIFLILLLLNLFNKLILIRLWCDKSIVFILKRVSKFCSTIYVSFRCHNRWNIIT